MAGFDRGAAEAKRFSYQRSPDWPKAEEAHRQKEPTCVCCKPGMDSGAPVQVHHIFPFHYCIALGRPDLELDDRNLITLCDKEEGKPSEDHHLLVGHLNLFQSANLKIVLDVKKTYHGSRERQIKSNPLWEKEVHERLKPLDAMSNEERDQLRKLMDKTLPIKSP